MSAQTHEKVLSIVIALAIAAMIIWNIAFRRSTESTVPAPERANDPTHEPLATTHARTNPFNLARHIGAPEVTNVVGTAYTVTANGKMVPVVRTQAVALGWKPTVGRSPEEIQAARERRREELKKNGEHNEAFAKEFEWKEKSKALKTGMTMQEVITVMGTPTRVRVPDESSQDGNEWKEVSGDALKSVSGTAMVVFPGRRRASAGW